MSEANSNDLLWGENKVMMIKEIPRGLSQWKRALNLCLNLCCTFKGHKKGVGFSWFQHSELTSCIQFPTGELFPSGYSPTACTSVRKTVCQLLMANRAVNKSFPDFLEQLVIIKSVSHLIQKLFYIISIDSFCILIYLIQTPCVM